MSLNYACDVLAEAPMASRWLLSALAPPPWSSGRVRPPVPSRRPRVRDAALLAILAVSLLLLPTGSIGVPERLVGSEHLRTPPTAPPANNSSGRNNTPYWTNLTAGPTPPPGTLIVNDSSDGYLLGYRPNDTAGPFLSQATWRFWGGTWKNITVTAGPGPYSDNAGPLGVALTYDSRDGFVLAVAAPDWTWEFHRGYWTQLSPDCTLLCSSFRFGGEVKLAYDPAMRSTMLFDGGGSSTPTGSIWSFAANTWVPLCSGTPLNYSDCWQSGTTPLTTSTGGYGAPAMAYDPGDHEIVLFGGTQVTTSHIALADCEMWTYANGTWNDLTHTLQRLPTCRDFATMTDDKARGTVVLFGGVWWSCLQGCYLSVDHQLNDTWTFAAGKWRNVSLPNSPPSEAAPSMAYDAGTSGVMCFQGAPIRGANAQGTDNATWLWSPTPPITNLRLTASATNVSVGLTVRFAASYWTATAPLRYNWSFGDGNRSAAIAPSESFPRPGPFAVSLTMTDAVGRSVRVSITVTVHSAQTGTLALLPNPADAGRPVEFSDPVSGGVPPVQVTWSFGDGQFGSGSLTNHTYSIAGAYVVTAWMNGSDGTSRALYNRLNVNPPLAPPTLAFSPEPTSLGGVVYFTVGVGGGTAPYDYAWDFGDGSFAGDQAAVSHAFLSDAPSEVVVTVTDSVGARVQGFVNHSTELSATVSANVTLGAAPLTVGFNTFVSGGFPEYGFWWAFGDGEVANGWSVSHTFQHAGNYTVALVVNDSHQQLVLLRQNVTVAPGGGPLSVFLEASNTSVPIGSSVGFTAVPSGGFGAYGLTWTDPPGCRSLAPDHLECVPRSAGLLAVGVSVRDTLGRSAEVNASVIVEAPKSSTPVPGNSTAAAASSLPVWLIPFGAGILVCSAAFGAGFYAARRPRPARAAGSRDAGGPPGTIRPTARPRTDGTGGGDAESPAVDSSAGSPRPSEIRPGGPRSKA